MIPIHFLVGNHEIGVVQGRAGIAVFVHGVAPGHVHLIPVAVTHDHIPAVAFATRTGAKGEGTGNSQLMHEILKALGIACAGGLMGGHEANHALILHIQHIVGMLDEIAVNPQNFFIVACCTGKGAKAIGSIGVNLRQQRVDFLQAQGIGKGDAGAFTQQGGGGNGISALAVKPEILRVIGTQGGETKAQLLLGNVYLHRIVAAAGCGIIQLVINRLQIRLQLLPGPQHGALALHQGGLIGGSLPLGLGGI